jgi:hypothetical protein
MPILTSDWTDDDVQAYLAFCAEIDCPDVSAPCKVWMNESACRTTAHNPSGDASGLFQLMPQTAGGLGYSVVGDPHLDGFRKLNVSQQLLWAAKFYSHRASPLDGVGPIYVCTFLPALLEHANDPSFVLCADAGPFSWAYVSNKSFDVAGKGSITVQDLVDAANRASSSARGQELLARIASAASAA